MNFRFLNKKGLTITIFLDIKKRNKTAVTLTVIFVLNIFSLLFFLVIAVVIAIAEIKHLLRINLTPHIF